MNCHGFPAVALVFRTCNTGHQNRSLPSIWFIWIFHAVTFKWDYFLMMACLKLAAALIEIYAQNCWIITKRLDTFQGGFWNDYLQKRIMLGVKTNWELSKTVLLPWKGPRRWILTKFNGDAFCKSPENLVFQKNQCDCHILNLPIFLYHIFL